MPITPEQIKKIIADDKEKKSEMNRVSNPQLQTPTLKTSPEDAKEAITLFKNMFPNNEHPPKKNDDGSITFQFKTPEDSRQFFSTLAKNNPTGSGMIIDKKTNTVMGYYKGGQLYHANGKECSEKDTLKPDAKFPADKFKFPENNSPSMGM